MYFNMVSNLIHLPEPSPALPRWRRALEMWELSFHGTARSPLSTHALFGSWIPIALAFLDQVGRRSWCVRRHGFPGHIPLLPILMGAREPARRHGAVIIASNAVGHVLTVLHTYRKVGVLTEARFQWPAARDSTAPTTAEPPLL